MVPVEKKRFNQATLASSEVNNVCQLKKLWIILVYLLFINILELSVYF